MYNPPRAYPPLADFSVSGYWQSYQHTFSLPEDTSYVGEHPRAHHIKEVTNEKQS